MYCKYRNFSGLTGVCTAVAADPFFGISGTVSCVLQYKTVAANLKILGSRGEKLIKGMLYLNLNH